MKLNRWPLAIICILTILNSSGIITNARADGLIDTLDMSAKVAFGAVSADIAFLWAVADVWKVMLEHPAATAAASPYLTTGLYNAMQPKPSEEEMRETAAKSSGNPNEWEDFEKDLLAIPLGAAINHFLQGNIGEKVSPNIAKAISEISTKIISLNLDLGTVSVDQKQSSIDQNSEITPTGFGGINFTSIRLSYISVNTDSSDGVIFDFVFSANRANGTSPRINPKNSTLIGPIAFMTGLAVPDSKFWVNLNPWEEDRIIDEVLNQSEVGRIMLEADFQMKRDFCSYRNPCANETGKALQKLRDAKHEALVTQCMKKHPGEIGDIDNVRFRLVTRFWIVPDKVYAYSNETQMYIINTTLTINSEWDAEHSSFQIRNQDNATLSKDCLEELNRSAKEYGEYNKELEDRMILPYVVEDLNKGAKYEDLRNVYTALALAQWYKSSITSHKDIFRESLDSSNTTMLTLVPWDPNEIWDRYVFSFNNGEYKCWENATTKTPTHTLTMNMSYSSGGVNFGSIKANLVGIDELPPMVQDQINSAVNDGFVDEGKYVLFGNRLHANLTQAKAASGSSSSSNAARLDPDLAVFWNNKGNTFSDQGKLNDAIEAYDEAVRLNPKNALAWTNKGSALNNQGRYDEAIKAFDEAIKLDPDLAIAWNNKGLSLSNLGKHDEAVQCFDKALELEQGG